ncbi:MAG: ribulose-phosphate 3-epimerase [Clostridium sp.]|jgi:ribulose-phosphate 3-epimerase|uniref:ribulose-phosphate 3-epimerase n=1 Tax=Clostridium sp. TaxID=1506 RepID=UPI0025C3FE5E|nr:ribulose-phosphate 3-epimerase [Clostridium sp.]MCH3964034.1 ribulose-phosphate 3-epimerase [Clostridium sp.]MCI1716235.1 ribulose-phosphate 3-epimerase [Clostridium sp.]MCI1800525.1 ribulose-phosphate 3-epimerase [Clostridium sp.]MCI1814412.1 ribulose-phosphate 3-epimerase [Clostridium sp.]MCI1871311.1 ribulose-phosphate 3-epimerase [Clostridium sp.]
MIKIAPSILSADFSKLGDDIKKIDEYGADMVHIDVMDGMFVPNISFGIPVIKSIRAITRLPFDVHLMIEEPSRYVEDFVKAGADIITVHFEADRHIDRTINYIKSFGVKAAVALNPATKIENIEYIIPNLDMVLVMSVNPGFGGQNYIDYCYDKIAGIKKLSQKHNEDMMIEVDGGIGIKNIKKVVESGANVIVAGSAVFRDGKVKENMAALRGELK